MASDDSPDARPEQWAPSLMSFACGVLAGAAFALMFAPAKGRDTRSFLQRRSRRLAEDVSDRSREVWNQQRESLSSAIDQGRQKAAALSSQIHAAVEQGKAGYREAKRGLEEAHDAL